MDFVVANFSLHKIGVAASLTGHTQVAVGGSFPQ
jgi:hypothetical protein